MDRSTADCRGGIDMNTRVVSGLRYAQRYGIQKTFDYARYRLSEIWFEHRFDVSTSRVVELSEFGIGDKSLREYRPLAYLTIRQVMGLLPASQKNGTFIDFGSGMGRVLIAAANGGFKDVIGIELVEDLNVLARQNIEKAGRHLRGARVRVNTVDARLADVPDHASVFFFYNPFGGQVLADVLSNIRCSLERRRRDHTIVYIRPPGSGAGWVGEQDWLIERQRIIGHRDEEVFLFRHR